MNLFFLLSSEMAVMSLMDHEGASSRGGGSDCDQLNFPYQYPIPHPYSSPHPLHQLAAFGGGGGGGSPHSDGNRLPLCLRFSAFSQLICETLKGRSVSRG